MLLGGKHFYGLLLFILVYSRCHGNPCASFIFPSLRSPNVLTATENETITLPFQLNNMDCFPSDNLRITIRKQDREDKGYADYCTIRRVGGFCRQVDNATCGCLPGTGQFQLQKVVDKSDNTLWLWTSNNSQMVENKDITFNILYPATIHNLTTGPDRSHDNQRVFDPSVEIVCKWENGNPPVTARLLDRHGVEMEGSINSSGQIRYTFPTVGCQDAGLIRCEAPGASHNKSLALLVKCEPDFSQNGKRGNISTILGRPLSLEFPARTHTTDFKSCQLTRRNGGNNDTEHEQDPDWIPLLKKANDSFCNLTGTPPDLTLTVRLDNVTERELGQWRLELTNEVGTGYLEFDLTTAPFYDETTKPTTTPGSNGHSITPVAAGVVYVAIVVPSVAVVVVASLIFCSHRSKTKHVLRPTATKRGLGSRPDSGAGNLEEQPPNDVAPSIALQDMQMPCGNEDADEYWEVSPDSGASRDSGLTQGAGCGVYERPASRLYRRLDSTYEPIQHVYN